MDDSVFTVSVFVSTLNCPEPSISNLATDIQCEVHSVCFKETTLQWYNSGIYIIDVSFWGLRAKGIKHHKMERNY